MTIDQWIEKILPFLAPFGLAIAWLWNERRRASKDIASARLSEADRERAYSDRMEARLKTKELELEQALLSLMEARAGTLPPEMILKEIVDADPGLMFVKKRIGPMQFRMLRVSSGYANTYMDGPAHEYDGKDDQEIWGHSTFNIVDEDVYAHGGRSIKEETAPRLEGYFVGRKFPVRLDGSDYVVGIGSHVDKV